MSKSKKPTVKKPVAREGTIRELAVKLVKDQSLTCEGVIKAVKAKFPKSAFSNTHVYWYRRLAGVTTPLTHDGAAKTAKKPAAKTAKKPAAKKPAAKKPATKKPAAKKPAAKKPTEEKSAGDIQTRAENKEFEAL